jgi:4,5-DOPA dioxygenase extradiol
MPAAFVGHGSPMNALDDNRYTRAWRALADAVPRPRAVLVVSAHWYIGATAVTAMARPRTIHDFFGFPAELFAVDYAAPGAPEVAAEVAEVVKPRWLGLDRDSWGIDHGAWSVLVHMFPRADVPIVQLSINSLKSYDEHLDLAARLAPLRERGVWIVGSGNVVHDLRRLDWGRRDHGYDWARDFDEAAREVMTSAPGQVLSLLRHPHFADAAPTPDHFLPLLYLAGLADQAGRPASVVIDGYFGGSISMTAFALECGEVVAVSGGGAAPLPDPDQVPPDGTNT